MNNVYLSMNNVYFEKKKEELEKACLPVVEFLNKHYNPHAYAIITEGRCEIVVGDMSVKTPVRD